MPSAAFQMCLMRRALKRQSRNVRHYSLPTRTTPPSTPNTPTTTPTAVSASAVPSVPTHDCDSYWNPTLRAHHFSSAMSVELDPVELGFKRACPCLITHRRTLLTRSAQQAPSPTKLPRSCVCTTRTPTLWLSRYYHPEPTPTVNLVLIPSSSGQDHRSQTVSHLRLRTFAFQLTSP